MYSERLEVKAAVYAGELIRKGVPSAKWSRPSISRPTRSSNAPATIRRRRAPRPAWFWEDVQYGGILCDIGSHQIDQFLFYTGSTKAEIVAAQVANVRHPDHPHFLDVGDMMLKGDKGFGLCPGWTGSRRMDWAPGVMGGCSCWAPTAISKCANMPMCPVAARGSNLFLVDWQARPLYRLQRRALPFRAAIRRRYRRPHPYGPGPGAMPVGGRALHPGPDECPPRRHQRLRHS